VSIDPRDTDATRLASLPRPDAPPGAGGEIRIGTVIAGRFTLVEEIGEGGMGSVWVAQQTEPLKRIVAIKFAKAGASSASVLARFEQERQALALMDHPNIAQVYDAGLTSTGQPFFVMELVRGRTLTRYCDEARLTPRQRLDLFVPICQAVQHAHQKGVVHRDLKPGNILIAQVDGKPMPKVIDFGVAKAIEGSLLADSDATQFGMVVGTLEYMAPEQAGGQSADVDTRADVYSLGVILYELLTGQRPHDTRRLKEAAWAEMIRVIREDDPLTPSKRLATEETLPTLAAARQTEPGQLVSLLRGDLDWVVMKCLEKQRERRYETANALARDIERFLADEVVDARPPTTGYRLGKFLKRHRGAAAAAAAIAAALIVGLAAFAWQANVARRQRDLAEEARRSEAEQRKVADQNAQLAGQQAALAVSTVQSLIIQANEKLQGPGLYDIRLGLLQVALQNVDGVAAAYLKGTSKEATALAAMVGLGSIYQDLGEPEKASQQFLKALEIAKERIKIKNGSDPSRRNLALIYSHLGAVAQELNRDLNASLDYYQKSLALFEDIDQHPMLADSPMEKPLIRSNLADAYQLVGVYHFRVGQLPEGLPYYEKCYAIMRDLASAQPADLAIQMSLTKSALAIGVTAFRMGDRTRGAAMLAEARHRAEAALTARPADPSAKRNLADVLTMIAETNGQAGDLRGARTGLQEALRLYDEIAKAEPRNIYYQRSAARAYYTLGAFDLLEEKAADARTHFDGAMKIRRGLAATSKVNDRLQVALALVQAQVGQVDAAMTIADRFAAGASVDPEERLELARCYAIGSRTLPASDAARASALQTKAMDAIRAAVRDGYRDRFYLEGEPDFAPLRGREDFKTLVAGMTGAGR